MGPYRTYTNTCIVVTGIWLHESGVFGVSPVPDGIANLLPESRLCPSANVAASNVLVEVKCPYTARNMTVVAAAINCKNFCLGKFSYSASLNFTFFSPTNYYIFSVVIVINSHQQINH